MELEPTILVSQARSGSTRLPQKVLLKIQGRELLNIQLTRLRKCKEISKIIIATTTDSADDVIAALCERWDVSVSRGQINDVLDRYYQAVLPYKPKWVVRVTSDCPLIDPELVDDLEVVFAPVLQVHQGVVQRRAIVAGEAVALAQGARGGEDPRRHARRFRV
jgi:spore coat polysaccharide biosynthesis protein SpsF (cytidylyltransferase family)